MSKLMGNETITERATLIAENKQLGLLCACNAMRVPYHGVDGKVGTGTKRLDGVTHGYDYCEVETDGNENDN